jgi:hypothetical protein
MTKHNTPQLSPMDLPIHCAIFLGLSRLSTIAVDYNNIMSNTEFGSIQRSQGNEQRSVLMDAVMNFGVSGDEISYRSKGRDSSSRTD